MTSGDIVKRLTPPQPENAEVILEIDGRGEDRNISTEKYREDRRSTSRR